jgi:tetratricopeptide (TPR) repeat protein
MPKVFISAVSKELKSYRTLVEQSLQKQGVQPEFQELFELSDEEILELLRRKLADCDAVICLIGFRYGAEPSKPIEPFGRCSFTQFEYHFTRARSDKKVPIYRLLTTDATLTDQPNDESDTLRQLQLDFRTTVTTDQNWRTFANADQLRAEIAELQFPWRSKRIEGKPNNLPLVGSLFKGRDEFLEQLRSVLVNKPTHIAAVTAKQAIHGLGGVGKTRVAVEYAKRFSHEYTALLFITADSEASLKTNLANLCGAMVLNLPEQSAREQEVQVAAAIRWLREQSGWFLIVDNVDTPEAATAAEELLQKLDSGHVVITSRLSNWGGAVQELALDVIAEKAAVEMLLERTAGKRKVTPSDDADALALAKDLGCLPLALEQAGAFIVEDGCSFAEYRKLWQKKDAEVVTWHTHLMKYPRSVATTWQTSFEKVGQDGQALLNVLCWLSPEPIPLPMLEKLDAAEGEPTINWKKARRDLARYSFAKWSDATNSSIVVHRLVQEITEYRLPEAEKLSWLKRSLQMVNYWIPEEPDCFDVRSWPTIFVPGQAHMASVIHHAEKAKISSPTTRVMICLAGYLDTRASHAEAEPLYRRALTINEASYGSDHPEVAIALNNLAELLRETNRLAEAEPLMRRALAIDEASFGQDHPKVSIRLNNLALILQDTNRLAEAEPLMRRALAIDEQSYGNEHPKVAIRLNNLAKLLYATNRLAEAEPLMRRALLIDEQSYGKEHPNVAIRLNNLAQLLKATNRLAEAEPLMERVVHIFEISHGEHHPNVAVALNNLAQLLKATNRLAEAEPLYRRALAIDEASFGPDHPNVARDLNNLAQLLKATNRLAEAEPLMRRALAIFVDSLGADHPNSSVVRENLDLLLEAIEAAG